MSNKSMLLPPFYNGSIDTDYLLIAQEDGLVHLFDTSADDPNALVQDYETHDNAVFDVKWLPSGKYFLTASGDQSIRLIDTERGVVVNQFFGHSMSVRSLSLMPSDGKIFASASRDGNIRIWDIRLKSDVDSRGIPGMSSVGFISQCHVPDWPSANESENSPTRRPRTPSRRPSTDAKSVTSVVFMNDSTLISAGSTDGAIKMWDLRRLYTSGKQKTAKPKLVFPYRGMSLKRSGYSDLHLDSTKTRLYANCLDNVIYEYDLVKNSTRPTFVYTGHQTDSFYIKLDISPDDNFLICGSSDRRAYIYAVGEKRQLPVFLSGHTGEVSVPRWCRGDPTRVVTLSDDARAFVWNMFPARSCVLPAPGELAGMAQRLTPSQTEMSNPSMQQSRILRSPCSRMLKPNAYSSYSTTGRSAARRRQSNIRSFLAVTLPASMKKPSASAQTAGSTSSVCSGRIRNPVAAAVPPETLAAGGGVVQRFPGLTVGTQRPKTPPSTPPLGWYVPNASPNRQTPLSKTHIIPSPGEPDLDQENLPPVHWPQSPKTHKIPSPGEPDLDQENQPPVHWPQSPISQFELPLEGIDGTSLTKSPVMRCSLGNFQRTPENSPRIPTKRKPLGLARGSLNTSQHPVDTGEPSNRKPANDQEEFQTTSQEIALQGRAKRRRLTVYATSTTHTATTMTPSPPALPRTRRRRMTSVFPSPSHSITRYFKRDD